MRSLVPRAPRAAALPRSPALQRALAAASVAPARRATHASRPLRMAPQRAAGDEAADVAVDDAASALPRRCRDAIDLGLQAFAEKEYEAAADLFQLALTLPGSGAARRAGSVKEFAVPSQGEANSALYNLACCFAAQGKVDAGVAVLRDLLDNGGFDDVAALRTDPDLAPLRAGGGVDALLREWDSPVAKLKRSLAARAAPQDSSNGKKWFGW